MRAARLLSVLLLGAASFSHAQQCTSYVSVNAFDQGTKAPLYALTARDFSATMGSAPASVVGLRPAFRNRVVVLVDGASPAALNASADLVREAPQGMPVAIAVFGEHSVLSNGFFSQTEELNVAIDTVLARGKSLGSRARVFDAIHRAATLFEHPQPGDTILLVTDRHESGSHISRSALQTELQDRGVRVQLLLPPAVITAGSDAASLFSPWTAINRADNRVIRLAAQTGGAFMGFMNAEWLNVASSGYVMQISLDETAAHGTKLHLSLRQPGGEIFYSQRVLPCTTSLVAGVR